MFFCSLLLLAACLWSIFQSFNLSITERLEACGGCLFLLDLVDGFYPFQKSGMAVVVGGIQWVHQQRRRILDVDLNQGTYGEPRRRKRKKKNE